jgi:formiminotetrahydrofolate cyclodeaminase
MDMGNQTIQDFLSSLSQKQPTPGGGAVAGLLAALSTSLGCMVVAYSQGKKKYAEHESLHHDCMTFLNSASAESIVLGNADADAYETLNTLWKLDIKDPTRVAQWDNALANAINVPLQTIKLSKRILETLEILTDKTNAFLSSDLIIAAILADAAARSARLNVEINVAQMAEGENRNALQEETSELCASCRALCTSIEDAL